MFKAGSLRFIGLKGLCLFDGAQTCRGEGCTIARPTMHRPLAKRRQLPQFH